MLTIHPSRGVVLLGSSSEIGGAILNSLNPEPGTPLILMGRDSESIRAFDGWPGLVTFMRCDLKNVQQIRESFNILQKKISVDFAIVASAHLPKENQHDDFDSVLETFSTNSTGLALAISQLANQMKDSGGTIIYLSSVACLRPRIKNFTYAASKRSIDFFTLGLAAKFRDTNLDIRIVRPGFVYSKLSKGFEIAPFATTPSNVAEDVIRGLSKSKSVIYSPRILRLVMPILRMLPSSIFHKL